MKRAIAFILAAAASLTCAGAQEAKIPSFWDSRERLERPPPTGMPRLRFLTTVDFPPFNMLDADGQLVGFHVDLARDICRQLALDAVCQIQALPWDELVPALENGDGEAIIAGLAPTAELRERLAFSRPYLKFPARFAVARGSSLPEPVDRSIANKRVGVIRGSTHAGMLRTLFSEAQPVEFDRFEAMTEALSEGEVEAVFADGMRLSFWLAGDEADECCAFAGGPYLAPQYTGRGLAIAVDLDNANLAKAFDAALREIDASGRFGELYLRYFPVSFF